MAEHHVTQDSDAPVRRARGAWAQARRTRAAPVRTLDHDDFAAARITIEAAIQVHLDALDELVVHGWDIATATGQAYQCDDASLLEIESTVRQFRGDNEGAIPGLFGPLVAAPDDAPLLHTVLCLTGRDPHWSPT